MSFRALWTVAVVLLVTTQTGFAQTQTISYIAAANGAAGANGGITYVGAGTATASSANGGNANCPYPSGWQAGDMLLCVIEAHDNSTISMDNTWTRANFGNASDNHRGTVYWKIAATGDATSPTVTHAGTGVLYVRMIAFRGVDTANPIQGTPSMSSRTNDDSITIPAYTTTTPGAMAVFTVHADDNGDVGADGDDMDDNNWKQAFSSSTSTGNDATIEAWYKLEATARSRNQTNVDTEDDDVDSYGGIIVLNPSTSVCVPVAKPTGTVVGNVMIASVAARPKTATLTAPSGWTQIVSTTDSTGGNNNGGGLLVSYYKVATTVEPASYSWCTSSTASDVGLVAGIVSFSGVDPSSPVNASGGNATASAKTHTANAITTTVSNTMLVGNFMMLSAYSWAAPTGMTERVDRNLVIDSNQVGVALEMATVIQAAAGSSGTKTATNAASSANADTGAAQLIALRPASTVTGPAGPLNAVDPGLSAVIGVIKTKTAGTAFTLDLAALNAAKTAVDTSFNGNVKVELLLYLSVPTAFNSTTTCPTATPDSTITVLSSQALASGIKSNMAFPAVANAWPYAKVRISFPATGTATKVGCSSDAFAVKPATLTVVAQDADPATEGMTNTLSAATATATPIHKASRPFRLKVTASNSVNAVTTNYSATSFTLGDVGAVAINTNEPTTGDFDVGTFSSNNGVITSTTATYSEVGIVSLHLEDNVFAAVDSGDGTSGDCSGFFVCSPAVTIGRFVPDHFRLAAPAACSASGKTEFTYSGQPMPSVTVTAKNAVDATTRNYDANIGYSKQVTLSDTTSAAGGWNNTNTIASSVFIAGTATLTSPTTPLPTFTFTNKLTLQALLNVRATDTDSVDSSGYDSTVLIRSGRLRLSNVFGSEKAPLQMPVRAEYWSGNNWISNGDDSCTTLASTNFFKASASPAIDLSNVSLSNGSGNLTLTPTTAATGSVDIAANLGASGSSQQSCLTGTGGTGGTAAGLPWLRSRNGNCAATYDRDPSARATFGIYPAEKRRLIHVRELF